MALRIAIPELKRRLVWCSFENKEPYRRAIREIEAATAQRKGVPVAANTMEKRLRPSG